MYSFPSIIKITEFEAVIPVGSSSVNLIIPVQGAEGPAVWKNKINTWKKHSCWLCHSASADLSGVTLTSEAGSVGGIHGNHSLRDTGRTADSCLVQGPHPEGVRAPLHQSCDGEAGVLHRFVVTLSPVVSAHLAPAQKTHQLDLWTPQDTSTVIDWQLQQAGRNIHC